VRKYIYDDFVLHKDIINHICIFTELAGARSQDMQAATAATSVAGREEMGRTVRVDAGYILVHAIHCQLKHAGGVSMFLPACEWAP
jgi:hypothetical protein